MKNILFLSLLLVSIVGCKNNEPNETQKVETESTTAETPVDTTTSEKVVAQLYSCPMHPEVKGEKDSECSKCGMPLTEPVK